uniref:Abnormal spindle-like microcephaly-associated protein n=1 Tax=Ceratitis capitata TaxID=7213 RepID=W8AK28_CERCA
MHIHPSSPNYDFNQAVQAEENAAIKIQAGFRGYRVRKQMQQNSKTITPNGYQQSQQPISQNSNVASSSSNSMQDINNSTVEDRCATRIQAGVRGFLVRKKQKIASEAATKIQASFRGFKVRKETQNLKQK